MAAEAQLSFVIDTTKAKQNLAQLSEMADSVYDQIQKQGSQGMLDLEAQQIQKDAKSIIKSLEKVQNEADKLVLTTNIEAFYNSLNKLRDKAKDLKLDLDIPEFSFNIDNAEISDLKSIKDLSRKIRDSISKQLDFDLQKFDVLNDKTKNAFKKSINKSVEGLFSVLKSPAKDVDINKTIEEYMNTVFSAGALDAGFRKKRDIAGKFTSQFEKMFSDEDILKTLADKNISIDGIKAQWESKINDIEAIKAMQAQLYNTAIGNQSSNITSFGKIFTNDDIEAMKSEGKTVEELKLQLKSLVSTFQQLGNFNDAGTKGNAGIDEFYNTLLDIQSIVSKINDTGIEKIDIKSLLGTGSVNILKEARSEMKNSIDYLMGDPGATEGIYADLFEDLAKKRKQLLQWSKDNFSAIGNTDKDKQSATQYLDTVNSIIATIQRVDSVKPNGLIDVLGGMSEAFEMRGSLISRMKELGIEISEVDEKANSAVASIAKMYGISMSSGTGSGTKNGSQNNGTGSGNGSGNSTSNGSGVSSEEMNEVKSKLDQTQTALTNVEARLQALEGKNDTDVINAVNSIQEKINTLQDQINKIPTEKIDLSQLNGINEILSKLIPTLEALDTDSLIDLAKNINNVSAGIKALEGHIKELQATVSGIKPGVGIEELTSALQPIAKTSDIQSINVVEKAVESINNGTEEIIKAKENQQDELAHPVETASPTNNEPPIVPDISAEIKRETEEVRNGKKELQAELAENIAPVNMDFTEEQRIAQLEEMRAAIESDISAFEELNKEIGSVKSIKEYKDSALQMITINDKIKDSTAEYNKLSPDKSFATFGFDQSENDKIVQGVKEQYLNLKNSKEVYIELKDAAKTYEETLNKNVNNDDYQGRLDRLKALQEQYEKILEIIQHLKDNNQWLEGNANKIIIKDKTHKKTTALGDSLSGLDKSIGVKTVQAQVDAINNAESIFEKYKKNITEIGNMKITNKDEFTTAYINLKKYNDDISQFFTVYREAVETYHLPKELYSELNLFGGKAMDFQKKMEDLINKINYSKKSNLTKDIVSQMTAAQDHLLGVQRDTPKDETNKTAKSPEVPTNQDIEQQEKQNETLRDKITLTNEEIKKTKELRDIINSGKYTNEQRNEYASLTGRISNELRASGVKNVSEKFNAYFEQIQKEVDAGISSKKIEEVRAREANAAAMNDEAEAAKKLNDAQKSASAVQSDEIGQNKQVISIDTPKLDAILTEVSAINSKMDKPTQVEVVAENKSNTSTDRDITNTSTSDIDVKRGSKKKKTNNFPIAQNAVEKIQINDNDYSEEQINNFIEVYNKKLNEAVNKRIKAVEALNKKMKTGNYRALLENANSEYYNTFASDIFVSLNESFKGIQKYIDNYFKWAREEAALCDEINVLNKKAGKPEVNKSSLDHLMGNVFTSGHLDDNWSVYFNHMDSYNEMLDKNERLSRELVKTFDGTPFTDSQTNAEEYLEYLQNQYRVINEMIQLNRADSASGFDNLFENTIITEDLSLSFNELLQKRKKLEQQLRSMNIDIEKFKNNANEASEAVYTIQSKANQIPYAPATTTSTSLTENQKAVTEASVSEVKNFGDINTAVATLTESITNKTKAIGDEAIAMTNAATTEIAALERIQQKVMEVKNSIAGTGTAGKIIMPDNSEISVPQKITSANSGSALGSEIAAVGKLKTAFEDAGKAVDAKTTAITTEQTTMANAATTEVADIQKIIDALETLRSKITSLPKINVAGELNASTPVSIIFNYNEDQIKVIREKINAELNGNNAVPISFIPDVKSLKDQIASELKNIPVTLNGNKQVLNVTNIKVDTKTTEALKNNISNSLTELKIQSFSITDNAKTKLINELSGMLNNIGLAFDTSKLQQNISNAIQASQAMAQNNQGNNSQNSNNQNNNATGNNQNANDALKGQIESYDKLKNKISEVEKQINKLKTYNYNKEFKDDFNSILGSISALGNVDTNNQSALTDWIKKSGAILKNWTKIEQRVKDAANYRATTSARTNYEDIVNKNATQKARNSYAVKKFEQVRDQYTSIKNDRGTLTDEQLNVIEQKYKEVYSLILKTGRVQNEFTAENLSKIDQEQQKFSEMIHMFQSANSGTGIFKIDTGRINNEIQKIENTMLNNNNTNLNSSINSVRNLLNQYNQMSANVGKMNYSELEKYAQLISTIKTQVDNIKVSSNAIQNSLRNDNSVNKAAAKMDELIVKMRQFAAQNSRINSDQTMKSQFAEMLRQAEALPKTAANWQMMTRQFNAFKAAVTSKGLTGRSVGDELRYIMEKIGLKAILGNQIYRIIGYLRQMVTVVKEIDSGMTDLKRVSQETETTYAKFLDASVEKAHALGSAMSNVIDATSKFSRLGYNLSEATALAENAIMYSNVGWLDIDTATADITSTMKAFNIEASDSIKIVDTFDILGKKLPLVTISVKGWRHSRPSKDIVFIFVSMKKLKLR